MFDYAQLKEMMKSPPVWVEESSLSITSEAHQRVFQKTVNWDIEKFHSAIMKCSSCAICHERLCEPLPPGGDEFSSFVFIGRNPNVAEVESGEYFDKVYDIGACFHQEFLEPLKLNVSDCYFTNALFCNTMDERPPEFLEAVKCSYWKATEFKFLEKAKFIFLVGMDACRCMLGINNILELVGKKFVLDLTLHNSVVYFIPMMHPGYLLRNMGDMRVHKAYLRLIQKKMIQPFLSESSKPEFDSKRWECSW